MKNMRMLKSTAIKLDENTGMIVAYIYHSEKGNRKASEYRYEGRVFKIEDLNKEIDALKADPDTDYQWPGLKDVTIQIDGTKNKDFAKWLNLKKKKLQDWDLGQQILKGFKPSKNSINPSAAYDLVGAVDQDGNPIDVTDKDSMSKIVGKTFTKIIK